MGSIKTLKIKLKYAKKIKQNRPIPYWVRFKLHHFPLLSFSSLCEHIPSYIDILHLYTHQP